MMGRQELVSHKRWINACQLTPGWQTYAAKGMRLPGGGHQWPWALPKQKIVLVPIYSSCGT
jgi:hypothetical protein